MPEPGRAPEPAFKRGESLPYGQAAAANAVPSFLDELPLPGEPEEDYQPADDTEAFLASASDRPDQPLSAGAPFGPGPDVVPRPQENERDFLARVATSLETTSLPGAREFASRVRRGL